MSEGFSFRRWLLHGCWGRMLFALLVPLILLFVVQQQSELVAARADYPGCVFIDGTAHDGGQHIRNHTEPFGSFGT